ncbi:hypothetical protein Tco_0565145 [Tanacetum coccineum]
MIFAAQDDQHSNRQFDLVLEDYQASHTYSYNDAVTICWAYEHDMGQVCSCDGGIDDGPSIHKDRSSGIKVCGGGRCGRKGGIEDVWRVENVVVRSDDEGGSTCEVVVVLPNLFNDLFTCHEGFRIGTKSTISPIEVGSWIGDNAFEEISIMFVLAIFLGGFLVEEDALEAIFEEIKVDSGKDMANVGVIEDRKYNENVKCQDKEQKSMRELEYRVKEHYEREDDDDHDGTEDFQDSFHG